MKHKIQLVLLFLAPLLFNCMQKESENLPNQSANIRYLALGDSYTIGEAVDQNQRWPMQLATKLKQEQVHVEPVQIIAKTGWTTNELIDAVAKENPQGPFDLVSLLIGVNNQYRGYSISQYEQEFTDLLKKGISLAGDDASRTFVVSIPDYGVTPFAANRDPEKIARELDAYNAMAKKIAEEHSVLFIDITPISRHAANDLGLVAHDQLHPSAKMYTRWVNEKIYDAVSLLLKNAK